MAWRSRADTLRQLGRSPGGCRRAGGDPQFEAARGALRAEANDMAQVIHSSKDIATPGAEYESYTATAVTACSSRQAAFLQVVSPRIRLSRKVSQIEVAVLGCREWKKGSLVRGCGAFAAFRMMSPAWHRSWCAAVEGGKSLAIESAVWLAKASDQKGRSEAVTLAEARRAGRGRGKFEGGQA